MIGVGMRVAVVGAGYVGLTTALVAEHGGFDVRVLDANEDRVQLLNHGKDPLGEPHIAKLLETTKIVFTAGPRLALAGADVIVLAVGTPRLADGRADLSAVFAAARDIAIYAAPAAILVRSTVPVGTGDRLQQGILGGFRVISNPEFLREGSAVADALYPSRVVAGGTAEDQALVEEFYGPILRQDYSSVGELRRGSDPVPFCWMDRRSAELTKYAANAFLATKLSFVNEIANVAGVVGADIRAIAGALGLDPRIAPAFLRPGIGWGGSCFPKDVRALEAFANDEGYDFTLLRAVIDQNNSQLERFLSLIASKLADTTSVRIGMLGLAFKSNTADCRESPAVALANLMIERGWEVAAYDPRVSERPTELSPLVRIATSAASAAIAADAIVAATEWPEFAAADLGLLRELMRGDAIFDGRCVIDPARSKAAGLRYFALWAPGARDPDLAEEEISAAAAVLGSVLGANESGNEASKRPS
jgi:UDPglucose 6-dehydrogenase